MRSTTHRYLRSSATAAVNLTILEELLRSEGYDVLNAASGTEALETYLTSDPQPKLVLLDVTLPDLSGHEVGAELTHRHRALLVHLMYHSRRCRRAHALHVDVWCMTRVVACPCRCASRCAA